MKFLPIVGAVLIVVAAAAGTWLGYLQLGGSSALTVKETGVFPSEHDAAYVGSESIKTAPPFVTLKQGETVSVLWDTYGKDYWACYVRTSAKQRGWVLCGYLQRST